MAQTTGQTTFVDAYIAMSTNGSAWTDISGLANELTVEGGSRQSGEVYTAEGDTPIIGAGKREPLNVKVKIVYTESGADAFEIMRAQYETAGGGPVYIKWSPKGNDPTEFVYTTTAGVLVDFGYPGGPVEPGDPLTVEMGVKVAAITKSAAT